MKKELYDFIFDLRASGFMHHTRDDFSIPGKAPDPSVSLDPENNFRVGAGERGILSANILRDLKYFIVGCCFSASSYLVEHGGNAEYAYSVSDYFINRADKAASAEEYQEIFREMIDTFMELDENIYIISTLLSRRKEHPVEIRIVDRIDKHFEWTKKYEDNVLYTLNPGNAPYFVKDIEMVMAERYKNKLAGKDIEDEHGLMVLFINNQDSYNAIDNNQEALQMFTRLTSNYRQLGMCIIMGQIPNVSLGYGAAQCIKTARDALRFMMFCNLDEQRNVDVSMTVSREFSKPLTTNEGYFVEGSHITKLRTVKMDNIKVEEENEITA